MERMFLRRNLLLVGMLIFVLLCSSFIVLVQAASMWSKTYGGTASDTGVGDIIQTSDGGYAISGNTASSGAGGADYWLVKTDAAGNMQWNKTYGGALGESEDAMCQTSDGGYALAGYTMSFGAGNQDFWLVKTDAAGIMQWNKTYGGTGIDACVSVFQTSDGGYALTGLTTSFGAGGMDVWLIKTDASGIMQWNKTYGGTGNDYGFSVVQTSDGGYAVAGPTASFGAGGNDVWLVKTDAAGSMQWNKTYGGPLAEWMDQMIRTVDGGYAIAGYTASFSAGGQDVWLVKTDALGNMQWNKTYGGTGTDNGFHMTQTVDGGYAIIGSTNSFGAGGNDFWLVKTNSAGTMEWNHPYGGTGTDDGRSLIQSVDGGYALAGNTNSFGAGGNDILLVKTDAAGVVVGGKFGNALEFDGVNDYVQVQDSPPLRNPSTELTIETWINFPSNSSGTQFIVRKWLDASGGWMSYVLGTNDNKIYGGLADQALVSFPSWTTVQTVTDLGINDTWAHVAFTWKKGNITGADGKIFVNGLSVNTTFLPQGYSGAFTIGYAAYPLYFARKADATWESNYFKGIVDEVRISNVSRTTFNLTSAPTVDASTIALWHFDEGTGPMAYDASANANNGTVSGAVWTGIIPEFPSVALLAFVIVLASVAIVGPSRLKDLKGMLRR